MIDNIIAQIHNYVGYAVPDADKPFLNYLLTDTDQRIMNDCNLASIPEGLISCRDDLVIGKYLSAKKEVILGAEQLSVVKSIKEGDTTVDFSGGTPEQRYNALVSSLTKERDFACYRKMRW